MCALNVPVAMNPGFARTIGTLMKQDFQRAVLNRIPLMDINHLDDRGKSCFFATSIKASSQWGRATGDGKFFALSREATCIPIVAAQSISSLRSTRANRSVRFCRRSALKSSLH